MTHGLWTKEELSRIKQGKDTNLITEFLNEKTFSKEEIGIYPYTLRRTFECWWHDDKGDEVISEPTTIYATDVKSLRKYLNKDYTRLPDQVMESITHYKDITL